jgi:hypothetical protein
MRADRARGTCMQDALGLTGAADASRRSARSDKVAALIAVAIVAVGMLCAAVGTVAWLRRRQRSLQRPLLCSQSTAKEDNSSITAAAAAKPSQRGSQHEGAPCSHKVPGSPDRPPPQAPLNPASAPIGGSSWCDPAATAC